MFLERIRAFQISLCYKISRSSVMFSACHQRLLGCSREDSTQSGGDEFLSTCKKEFKSEWDRCKKVKVSSWKWKYTLESKGELRVRIVPTKSWSGVFITLWQNWWHLMMTSHWHGSCISSSPPTPPGGTLHFPTFSSLFGFSGIVMASDAWQES